MALEVVVVAVALASVPETLWTERRTSAAGIQTVSVWGADQALAERGFAAAFAVFQEMEAELNEWRPDSPLSAINRAAGGEPVEVGQPLCGVLSESLRWAQRTGGLFDPTWATLRHIWRFGTASEEPRPPEPSALIDRCKRVAYERVELSRIEGDRCRVRLPHAEMELGLGGVAKGWAVDRAVQRLRALGLRNFLVQAGGDLYAAGRKGGRPWQVGIRDPRGGPDDVFATLEVENAAFSTSGDYERFFLWEGTRYHHIIDPRTCVPAGTSRSATVLAPSAMTAEFLTKAVFIAGGAEGLRLAERNGAKAVLVTADNRVLVSKGLKRKLRWCPPTP